MKKIICAVLALTLLLALSACGGDGTATTTTQPTQGNNGEPVGYTFTYEGKQIGLGMKMDDVLALIGQPKQKNVSDSCAFGGTDTTYYYDSIRITTSDDKGYEWVYQISIEDDLVSTEEGISITDTAGAVIAKYGPSEGNTDALLIYSKDGMKLQFVIDEGVVTAIRYTML